MGLLSIKFNDNELSGIIPLEFVNLKQLKNLNLASNDIVGVIPKDIENLSELIEFNVANNALFGQILRHSVTFKHWRYLIYRIICLLMIYLCHCPTVIR